MKNKFIKVLLASSMLVSLNIKNTQATDFSKKENYYIDLCSSSSLTNSQKSTCKSFSKYLKSKTSSLKSSVSSQKNNINKTQSKINESASNLEDINKNISVLQKDIANITHDVNSLRTSIERKERAIEKLKKEIKDKETKLADQMYQMQSTYNSNTLMNYVLNAQSISDIYSRFSTIRELTSSDKSTIDTLGIQKKVLIAQENDLKVDKTKAENEQRKLGTLNSKLQTQQTAQSKLLKQHKGTLANQQNQLENTQNKINKYSSAQAEIDANLAKMISQAESSSSINKGTISGAALANAIVATASTKLGCHYYWGGSHSSSAIKSASTKLFDCSGLVNWTLYHAGYGYTNRVSGGYASIGSAVSKDSMQPGDIITFKYAGSSSVQHVGIYVGDGKMINALGEGSTCRPGNCHKNDAGQHAVVLSSVAPGTTFYKSIYAVRRL